MKTITIFLIAILSLALVSFGFHLAYQKHLNHNNKMGFSTETPYWNFTVDKILIQSWTLTTKEGTSIYYFKDCNFPVNCPEAVNNSPNKTCEYMMNCVGNENYTKSGEREK